MCLKYLKWVRQLKMDITNSANDGRIIIIPEKYTILRLEWNGIYSNGSGNRLCTIYDKWWNSRRSHECGTGTCGVVAYVLVEF